MPDPAADSADGPGICEEGETRRTGPSPHTRMCQRRLPKSSPQSCHLQAEGARPAPSSPMAKVTVLKEQLQHLLISWYPDLRPLKSHFLLPKRTTHLPILCQPFPSPLRSRWVTSSMGCSLHPPDTLPTQFEVLVCDQGPCLHAPPSPWRASVTRFQGGLTQQVPGP